MATGKEVIYECHYLGSHEDTTMKLVDKAPIAPPNNFARAVSLMIFHGSKGKYRTTDHFRRRAKERQFDVFDMEYVIRNGKCVEDGKYSNEYKNFKYRFRGDLDGVEFDAVFALSAEHDLVKSPLLIFITGCWKTKTGKRGRTY